MEEYTVQEYFIICMDCALKGKKPPRMPQGMDIRALAALAEFHSMDNLLYLALEKLEVPPEASVMNELREARDKAIVKALIQQNEKEWLLNVFSQNNINVLPLKGAILNDMYPSPGMRKMSDIDMLTEADKMDQVTRIMENGGYVLEHGGYHYSYIKEPMMNVEMHKSLVGKESAYYGYYKTIWSRLIPDEKLPCVWKMTWEDYFIFMLVHLAKHWQGGGFGVRSVMDIHVFMSAYADKLNNEYVAQELDRLQLTEFKNILCSLADAWFNGKPLTAETAELAEEVVASGTFGTAKKQIERKIDEYKNNSANETTGKIKYFFYRMFPPRNKMAYTYKFLEKRGWLLPFCWIHRLFHALFFKRRIWKKELKMLNEQGDETKAWTPGRGQQKRNSRRK